MERTGQESQEMSQMFKVAASLEETIKLCVKATISSKDKGIRVLQKEYVNYKHVLIPKVQKAVRQVVKDRQISVYAQQKWMLDRKLTEYIKNLPYHPMTFHNQSVWVEDGKKGFYIHLKTKQDEGEAVCSLNVPSKYRSVVKKACGKNNPVLGQIELIEDNRYGWINAHIVLRLPKPKSYVPKGWIGVDVGWNNLAVSAYVNNKEKISNVEFHGKQWKTRIIQLKYLLKQYQRANRSWVKWDFRLKNTTKYTVGVIAKSIFRKARKLHAGVAMEELTFPSSTKRWLIPRYKLKVAVRTLCEREGVPFMEVPARNTSITCNRCGYAVKENRNGEVFKCLNCGYEVNADMNAAVNVAKAAISRGYMPLDKTVRLHAEAGGHVARPLSSDEPMTLEVGVNSKNAEVKK